MLALPVWLLTYYLKYHHQAGNTQTLGAKSEAADGIEKFYHSVKTGLRQADEEEIKITGLAVYPFRGMVPADDPDVIEVGIYGIRYDRELALMDLETGLPVTAWRYNKMGRLRSRLMGSTLRVETHYPEPLLEKGLPTFLEFDLEEDPKTIGVCYVDYQRKDKPLTGSFEGY